jgi:hypothetical protein
MKPKPTPVKHWYKAIITTVPTGLHKAQSPTNLEAKYITTNKQNQSMSLASLVPNGTSVPRLIQGVSQQIFQQTTEQDKARLSRRMAHTAKKKEFTSI